MTHCSFSFRVWVCQFLEIPSSREAWLQTLKDPGHPKAIWIHCRGNRLMSELVKLTSTTMTPPSIHFLSGMNWDCWGWTCWVLCWFVAQASNPCRSLSISSTRYSLQCWGANSHIILLGSSDPVCPRPFVAGAKWRPSSLNVHAAGFLRSLGLQLADYYSLFEPISCQRPTLKLHN